MGEKMKPAALNKPDSCYPSAARLSAISRSADDRCRSTLVTEVVQAEKNGEPPEPVRCNPGYDGIKIVTSELAGEPNIGSRIMGNSEMHAERPRASTEATPLASR